MQSRAAIRYAKAMYDIANEENSVNEVYKDMTFINELNSSSPDFKNLLSNSQINYQDKKKAILSLTKSGNAITEKLIDLLIHNKRVTIIGDIAISVEYVKAEAKKEGKTFDDHIIHMLAHGVYHILGYDHENNENAVIMERKEIQTLKKINISNPY